MERIIELGNITLTLKSNVMFELFDYIQDTNEKPESGGIIIGYYIDSYSFIITDISKPSKNDRCSRYNFYRSQKNAQRFINKKFRKSNGKKIYLGEWHTHPENYPYPSDIDIISYKNQVNTNTLNSNITFMVIIGLISVYVGAYTDDMLSTSVTFNII